jgi:hypothetical protein
MLSPYEGPNRSTSCSVSNKLAAFITGSTAPQTQRSALSDITRFQKWLDTRSPTVELVAIYIMEQIVPHTRSAALIQRVLSNISNALVLQGQSPLSSHPLIQRFMRAVRKRLPKNQARFKNLTDFYDPIPVLRSLLATPVDCTAALRLHTLFFLRSITMMRSGDVASIVRSSIVPTTDMAGRRIVTFKYRGKHAKLTNEAFETNYIEYSTTPNKLGYEPADILLRYANMVTSLNVTHDFLFINLIHPYQPLSVDRIRTLFQQAMHLHGVPSHFTAHSWRAMISEFLSLSGINEADIDKRGGWALTTSGRSRVRATHYRSRIVSVNFVDALFSHARFLIDEEEF